MNVLDILHPYTQELLKQTASAPGQGYVLVGPKGSGKTLAAMWLSTNLLGQGNATSLVWPKSTNLLLLQKPDDRKTIGLAQLHGVLSQLAVTSYDSDHPRVVVIVSAEVLTDEASNALLKVLEEPPRNTIFLLLCNDTSRLLPTILSRLQQIRLRPAGKDQAKLVLGSAESNHLAGLLESGVVGPAGLLELKADPQKLERLENLSKLAEDFVSATLTQRFLITKQLAEAGDVADWLSLLNYTIKQKFSILERFRWQMGIVQVEEGLNHNLNPRLLLERFALELI